MDSHWSLLMEFNGSRHFNSNSTANILYFSQKHVFTKQSALAQISCRYSPNWASPNGGFIVFCWRCHLGWLAQNKLPNAMLERLNSNFGISYSDSWFQAIAKICLSNWSLSSPFSRWNIKQQPSSSQKFQDFPTISQHILYLFLRCS